MLQREGDASDPPAGSLSCLGPEFPAGANWMCQTDDKAVRPTPESQWDVRRDKRPPFGGCRRRGRKCNRVARTLVQLVARRATPKDTSRREIILCFRLDRAGVHKPTSRGPLPVHGPFRTGPRKRPPVRPPFVQMELCTRTKSRPFPFHPPVRKGLRHF